MADNKHPAPPPPPPRQSSPPAPPPKPAQPHDEAKHPERSPYATEPGKLPPVGSRDYVAGQPIDEEEQKKVEGEHDAKMKAAEDQRKAAEAKAHHDEKK